MPKTKANTFEEKYPYLSRFVEEQGWIELGYDDNIAAFVKAYDSGGTVFEGKSRYKSIDDALQELEFQVKAYLGFK
ncbi:MAG: hypothetical protein ACKO2V_14870 [Snowella sp.]